MLNPTLQPFADGLAAQSQTDDAQKATIASQASALTAAQNQVTTLQNTITTLQLDDSTAQAMVAKLTPQLAASQAQVAALLAQIAGMFTPQDVLTGKITVTSFPSLQTHKRSPIVAGTTIGQDQEILLQWGDAGGTKADSNPNTVAKPHGLAVFIPGTATTPAHLAFTSAVPGDNEFLFMPLPTPSAPPSLFYSSRTYQCTAAEFAALICPESDSQIKWAGWIYNMGTQANQAGWRVFRYGNPGDWVLVPNISPMVDFVSAAVKFETLSSIDTVAHTVSRLAIRINSGPWIPVNMTLPAYNTGGTGNKYTCAVQLDPKSTVPTGMSILDVEERYLTVNA